LANSTPEKKEDDMGRTMLGIVLAAVAEFIWWFLFWSLNPLPYASWKQSTGEEAAQAALREHFPEDGTYFIPSPTHPDTERLHLKGPIAFLNIRSGGPMMDNNVLIYGLLQNLVVAAVLLTLLRIVPSAASGLANQVKFSALFGDWRQPFSSTLAMSSGGLKTWSGNCTWRLRDQFCHFHRRGLSFCCGPRKIEEADGTPIRV
jgi:hypothetical protein